MFPANVRRGLWLPSQTLWVHSSWSEVMTGLVSCSLEKLFTWHHTWVWGAWRPFQVSPDSLITLFLFSPFPLLFQLISLVQEQ